VGPGWTLKLRGRTLVSEMDIHTQTEIVLREAGYETWQSEAVTPVVTCFENQSVAGFIHAFDTCDTLLHSWQQSQQAVLRRYAAALRPAGVKAWNVYSVFLTAAPGTSAEVFEVEKIEEDFTLTRKIARCNVATGDDLSNALLPLLPIKAASSVAVTDYRTQLHRRLSEVSPAVAAAFISGQSPAEVANVMVRMP
jgi:hypothetical protein